MYIYFFWVKWDKSNANAMNFDASNAWGEQPGPSELDKHQIQGKWIDLSHFSSKSKWKFIDLIHTRQKNKIICWSLWKIIDKINSKCQSIPYSCAQQSTKNTSHSQIAVWGALKICYTLPDFTTEPMKLKLKWSLSVWMSFCLFHSLWSMIITRIYYSLPQYNIYTIQRPVCCAQKTIMYQMKMT